MKKLWIAIIILMVIVGSISSCCIMTDNPSAETSGSKESAAQDSNVGNLSEYRVEIAGCRLATDYSGEPIVIVKYVFSNYAEDPVAFYIAFSATVYQDGIGLNECYFADDSANYSSDNQTKEVKKGATIEVEVAYELNDTTTPIEVEVEEFLSFKDEKITKTFTID